MQDLKTDVWNPVETLPREALGAKQSDLLPARVRKAYEEGGLYRSLYDAAGVSPGDCSGTGDLAALPFVNKDMARAFQLETGHPFGGLSEGLVPGASVSHGTGTSGVPTLQVSTPADREAVADELASMMWMTGVREGTKLLAIQGFGVRVDLTLPLAAAKIGAVHVLPDVRSSSVEQITNLGVEVSWAFPGWLEGLEAAAEKSGRELADVLAPLTTLWWGGRYLSPLKRERLEAKVGATVFEMGGMGDVGLHTSSCTAQDGMHLREDMFIVEVVDPQTGAPVPEGEQGEFVFTSLWDEGMNHVRWRSDDIGVLTSEPCSCGRTSARIRQLGRVWERTVVNGVSVMPAQIDDVLYELTDQDVPFQLVRSKDGSRPPYLKAAVPDGVGAADVQSALGSGLQLELEVQKVPASDLVGPADAAYAHKYAQVRDE